MRKRNLAREMAYRETLWSMGLSDREIASRTGTDRITIRSWRKGRGLLAHLDPRRKTPLNPEEERRRHTAYAQGLSDAKTAMDLGIPASTYRSWRTKRGLAPRYRRPPRGTPQEILERGWKAYRMRKAGHDDLQIAKELGYLDEKIYQYLDGSKINRTVSKAISRMQKDIGRILTLLCRTSPACPLKPLLPEYNPEMIDRQIGRWRGLNEKKAT